MDFATVNAAALPALRVLVTQWIPGGSFRGSQYIVANPRRDDKSAGSFSVNIDTGIWKDFATTDAGRDPVSLYAFVNGIGQGEACKAIAAALGVTQQSTRGKKTEDYGDLVLVPPDDAPPFPSDITRLVNDKWEHYTITHRWAYRSTTGQLLYYVVRYNLPDGRKEVKPYCLHRATNGSLKWRSKAYPTPRPIYGLDRIASAPLAQVIVVEGEKCCQALQGLIDGACMQSGLVAVSWQGGSNAIRQTEWAPVRGRSVILWPDNDDPGIVAMHEVAAILKGIGCKVKQIKNPEDKPKGWDVADAILDDGWTLPMIFDWIRANKTDSQVEAVPPSKPIPQPSKPVIDEPYGPVVFLWQGKIDFNQSAIAHRYVKETSIIQDPRVGRFYLYDASTGLWRYQSDDVTVKQLGDLLQTLSREIGYPELLKKRTAGLLSGLKSLCKGYAERADAFANRPRGIHVRNGVLQINDAGDVDLKPFSADYYSRNRAEYDYDPLARCPRFLSELMRTAVDDDDISLIQRYVGQCLIGDNPSQTFLILRGTPGGGKGTLTNIIESVIGRHNTTELRVEHLCERFELYRYIDKTLICGKDVPGDFLNAKPAYMLKALVGGDQLTGEAKNGNDTFLVMGRFNCIITTNTRLRVRLDSDYGAWRRRMLIVDYERASVDHVITDLTEQLLAQEGPGILAWAVEGSVRLLTELRVHGKIQLTPRQQARVDDLLYESDSCQSFVRDCVVVEPTADLSMTEMSHAYRDYCDRKGWEALRERAFLAELPEAMLAQKRAHRRSDVVRENKSTRGFVGFTLLGADGKPVQVGF